MEEYGYKIVTFKFLDVSRGCDLHMIFVNIQSLSECILCVKCNVLVVIV